MFAAIVSDLKNTHLLNRKLFKCVRIFVSFLSSLGTCSSCESTTLFRFVKLVVGHDWAGARQPQQLTGQAMRDRYPSSHFKRKQAARNAAAAPAAAAPAAAAAAAAAPAAAARLKIK